MRCFFLQISIGNNTFRLSEFAILDSTEKHGNGSCSWSSPPWLRFLPAQQKRPGSGCRRSPASCRCNPLPVKCPAVRDRKKWIKKKTFTVCDCGKHVHECLNGPCEHSRLQSLHLQAGFHIQQTGLSAHPAAEILTMNRDDYRICLLYVEKKTWNNGFESDFGFRNNVRKNDTRGQM